MGRHTRRNEGATDMGEIRYMKVSRDFYEGLNALPEAQARKMLYACVGYFFTGECDLTGNLRKLFDFSQRGNLDRYRTSVLNGMKNGSKAGRKSTGNEEVSAKTRQLLAESDLEISHEIDDAQAHSPAETEYSGTTQPPTDGLETIVIDKSKSNSNRKDMVDFGKSTAAFPSKDEWVQFMEENDVPEPYGDEYGRLKGRGWTDGEGNPIRDWRAYLLRISEKANASYEREPSRPSEHEALNSEYPF